MRRTVWVVVGVLAVALGGLLLASGLFGAVQEDRTETFESVTELVLDLRNSPVEISGTDGTDALVELSTSTGFFGGTVQMEQSGGTLRLEQSCPLILGWGCRASIDISLPSGSVVSGSTSNGSITIMSLAGEIDVSTSNGSIGIEDVSSQVSLSTSNGGIAGTGLSSDRLEATTSNGRVELAFVASPSSVRATTSNGAIEVVLPVDAPEYAVDASTSNGELSTDVRTNPEAAESIFARSSNGDIVIRYEP